MKKSILLLEDEYSLAELIKIKLESSGFEVVSFYLGFDGLKYLENNCDCLILADYRLPDMDCSDFISQLEQKKLQIPFVVMTGLNDQTIGVEMMRRGALDFIIKSIGFIDKITYVVERAYEVKLMRQALNKSIENIKQNELKLRIFFENVEDIFFIMDKSSVITEISPSVFKILGYHPYEIIGNKIQTYFYKKKDYGIISEALRKGNILKSFETLLIHKNGAIKYLSISCSQLEPGDADPVIIGVAQDIMLKKQAELEVIKKVMEAEENERKKIASAIHDDIGPLISVIKMYFDRLLFYYEDADKREEITGKANEIIASTIQKTRDISNSLMPNVLELMGLKNAIYSFVDKVSPVCHTDFELNISVRDISKPLEIFLYRTSIELINNSLKHSEAKNISLHIIRDEKNLSLTYKDNGRGFDDMKLNNPEKMPGHGLISITNRISMLSGSYTIKSKPDKGFFMKIDFDINLI